MDTIAAVSTANSAGGIGVIRISGPQAITVADRVFCAVDGRTLAELPGYHAKFGHVIEAGQQLDQAVALVFRAPRSYTGENVVELSCHGGLYLVRKVLEAVLKAGAAPAEAGDFTKRAYLNGKMDLTAAESVMNLISASGAQAASASLNQLEGRLYGEIKGVLEKLLDCSANMAAWVDYPDEEIPDLKESVLLELVKECMERLEALLGRYHQGQAVLDGVDTAIVGRPNAGKSTLMNLLSGREKSIVTNIPGTTRDIVEDTVRIGNLVLHLNDTAGLRRSEDAVEAIGVQRAYDKIKQAQFILAVFDLSEPLCKEDRELIALCKGRPAIAVINKSDLNACWVAGEVTADFPKAVIISAGKGNGLGELTTAAEALLGTADFDPSAPMLAGERQKNCCRQALNTLNEAYNSLKAGFTYDAVNVLIDDAIGALLSLTGQKTTEAVVDQVFSNFCVGK